MYSRDRTHSLAALVGSVELADCQLELALMRTGIISPVDLTTLRAILRAPNLSVAVSVDCRQTQSLVTYSNGELYAVIHRDGHISTLKQTNASTESAA